MNFSTSYIEMYSLTNSFTFLFIYIDNCLRAILLKQMIRKSTKTMTDITPNMIQAVRWVLYEERSSRQPEGIGDMLSQII